MAPLDARWSFVLPVLGFAALCALAMWGTFLLIPIPYLPVHGGVLVYFTLLTLLLHGWIHATPTGDSKVMVRRFMASMAIKMMLSLIALTVLLLTRPKEQVVTLALVFMGCYLAFLVFSTTSSLRLIRRSSSP